MKYHLIATILLISSVTLPVLAEEAKQALIVDAPATWKVEFKGGEGWQLYTVKKKGSQVAPGNRLKREITPFRNP